MKAVIQRVSQSSVTINNEIVAQIQQGLLVLVGIEDADNQEDINWLTSKIANLRIFGDENEVMNLSLKDIDGEMIVVSQFTLHALTKKGNRPSYIKASKPEIAIPLYESFVKQMEIELGKKIQTGQFGADMKVSLVNDGPVTIIIDTKNKEQMNKNGRRFLFSFLINGLLYATIMYFIGSINSISQFVFSATFFGFFVGIFDYFMFRKMDSRDNKE